jgi:hypothetical protein
MRHVLDRIRSLAAPVSDSMDVDGAVEGVYMGNLPELRRCLRVIRYSLLGGASAMLDFDTGKDLTEANEDAGVIVGDEQLDHALVPYEKAVHDLLKSASEERYKSIVQMRGRLCSFTWLSPVLHSMLFKGRPIHSMAELSSLSYKLGQLGTWMVRVQTGSCLS